MPNVPVAVAAWVVALASGAVCADDARKPGPAPDPDAGFLEFLGGVDGLAEVNPDYLAQAGAAHPGTPPASAPASPPVTPAPPPAAGVPKVKSDE
ncbi:MAG: hypothetical protein JSR36_13345 [Proteobacteria bacterium]|nr:hypothetical protein [Pseudomonadota bacterium]